MKKSIPSFIFGSIFSIIGGICSYVFWAVFLVVAIFANHLFQSLLTFVPLVNIASFGITLIGSIICLFKAKVGKITILIGAIISLACYLTLIITLGLYDFDILLFLIPTLILFIIGIIRSKNKKKS